MKKGYTLVEILVVVAIIAALAAISIPAISAVRNKAERVSCYSNLKGIGVALEAYLGDNNGKFPVANLGRETKGADEAVIEVILASYVSGPEVFQCPSDDELFHESGSSYFWNESQSGKTRTTLSFLGAGENLASVPLVFDKEAFHGKRNGVNFLYADQSISESLNFEVDSR